MRFTIKPLGDGTRDLTARLSGGEAVDVLGPYGEFGRVRAAQQVWVAAGVGVTPFVALADALEATGPQVTLYYCVRSAAAAPHLAELQDLATRKPNLSLELIESSVRGRLSAREVLAPIGADHAQAAVLFCGPKEMREALLAGIAEAGFSEKRFHFEEFEIRSGVGLRKLAGWIWDQYERRKQATA